MTVRRLSSPKSSQWQRRYDEVITSDVVVGKKPGPRPPPEWSTALSQLTKVSRSPTQVPPWWTAATAYFGSVETRTDPSNYYWDGMKRLSRKDHPLFIFQFTLAGWGYFRLNGQEPRRITPGTGFFAILPSAHAYYLPEESPGWTFGWIGIYHPYLFARVAKQVAATGPIIEVPPDGQLTAIALRLVHGAIKKDFRDRYDVELALFELLLAYERSAREASDSSGERKRLVEEIRARIVASLPNALSVDSLAAEYGMSRSHFSHYFRERTSMTPGYFATEVRIHEATRMLLNSRAPLKQIADACGFANANHFCKVFRRIQHLSPASYRQAVGCMTAGNGGNT